MSTGAGIQQQQQQSSGNGQVGGDGGGGGGAVLPDDIWTPYKHLHKLIGGHLRGEHAETTGLEQALRQFRQQFVNPLHNAPKNATRRNEIVRGIADGITLPGLGHTTLSKDLVDETLIISDMYDLNEYVALELLCTAHQQMPNHPGLNRGLVAVLLYYDGRKTLASALRDLFQATEGVSWCVDAPAAVTALVTQYTNALVADGLLTRVLDQLERLDITRELALLGENRALGRPKHHRQVLDLFEEVRAQLAGVLFCRAAQQGLPRDVTVRLMRHLARYKPSGARGGMDTVTVTLLMALLYALDASVLQRHEDSEQLVRQLPIVAEPGFAQAVWDVLAADGNGNNGSTAGAMPWECEELRALVCYAFGLAMAGLRQAPQVLQGNAARIIDHDEQLVEAAIQGKVFDFVYHVLLENEAVFKVEFYYRRVHILLTDFIELMHSKVTELRARADETARTIQCHLQQGIEPPANLCQDFETLLLIVGRFYANDRLGLQLDLEYWKPMEGPAGSYCTVSTRSVSLFKFIRLAGDLLPPTLLVPYLKMLAGLSNCRASAQRTFDFLKQGYGVSGSTTLSWDHFFGSLTKYYANLRQEQHPTTDTIYNRTGQRGHPLSAGPRNINPQEIAGLQAVLAVIRAVATHDEFARIALCDHPNWQPLVVLLGLVGCAVPIPLKTELLLTLAALGSSRETALQLWANLEHSQIIATVAGAGQFALGAHNGGGGIDNDLRQIEARNEQYPLTQALLDFLYRLCRTAVPRNLGAGPRRPGLQPYVRFVVESVVLRFYNLNYKEPAEKWSVAEKALRLLALFVRTYEVRPAHFPGSAAGQAGGGVGGAGDASMNTSVSGSMSGGGGAGSGAGAAGQEESVPPGFQVMLQMNTNDKSELLRLILHIIDEACAHLDTYTAFAGRPALERACLHALHIVEHTLAQQDLFFDAHYAANCSILLAGLNKLLLGVNPRSARPDHMLNITKFVTYNVWLPRHALAAIRILTYIGRQPQVSGLLLGEFTRSAGLANEIRHGFVECLESDGDGGAGSAESGIENEDGAAAQVAATGGLAAEDGDDEDGQSAGDIEMAIKEAVLGLLDESLPQSAPNLAHYLLGFDIAKDIRATRLQQPGVMEFPSNCIKSLITLLDEGVEQLRSGRRTSFASLRLVERGYRLLYALCVNAKTSDVVLRFLRSCSDFLCRHLAALPLVIAATVGAPEAAVTCRLGQMTGLLQCLAIELKITAQNNQVTQFSNMCKILLGQQQLQSTSGGNDSNGSGDSLNGHTDYGALSRTFGGDITLIGGGPTAARTATNQRPATGGLLIIQLLNALQFDIAPVDRPKLDYFDASLLQQLLQSCEIQPPAEPVASRRPQSAPRLINIKRLDDVLRGELAVVQQVIASGQMSLILGEKEAVLRYALALNAQKARYVATVRFMGAWAQCTEMCFSVAPAFAIGAEAKRSLIIECLHSLLGKVQALDSLAELANLASGTVLQLLVTLRHCDARQRTEAGAEAGGGQVAAQAGPRGNSLSLKYILKHIVEWILLSGAASQKLKSNLYAALLNFMHIVRGPERRAEEVAAVAAGSAGGGGGGGGSNYVSRLDKSMALRDSNTSLSAGSGDSAANQTAMAVEVFAAVGDKLVDVLCQDCTGGHDICKMLALSCLDMLFDMDPMVTFVQFIARRGYLSHLVDGLGKGDRELCRVLETQPDNMKALYVYESKMAMLGRVAGTHIGAALVLEHKALGVLSQMKVFDMHPDFQLSSYAQQNGGGAAGMGGRMAEAGALSSFVPPVEQRYQQILFPALSLCDIVLSTLGPENRSAIAQVVYFLLSHGDMIEMVLRAGTPFQSVGMLEELAAITGLIARTANQEYAALSQDGGQGVLGQGLSTEQQDLGAHLWRLQKLMLALWPRFVLSAATLRDLAKTTDTHLASGDTAGRSERIVCCLRVAANLALYARNAIANHAADHRTVAVLFAPGGVQENLVATALAVANRSTSGTGGVGGGAGSLDVSPSIGLVVAQLRSTVEYWTRERHAHDGLMLQRSSLPALSLDAKNEIQFEQLTEKLLAKQTELKLCVFVVEHCLYLLWAHLDYFMLHAVPVQTSYSHQFSQTLSSTGDSAWKVTTEDVAQLKKALNQVLNETFSKQLLATAEQTDGTAAGVDRDFVAALLRRVKRLIQFGAGGQ